MKNTNRLIFAFLAAVALVFAAGCSDDSDSNGNTTTASDLAGTTWTYSITVDGVTWTMTLKFASSETATMSTSYTGSTGEQIEEFSYTVSDDGSTVTLSQTGGTDMVLTYSSGQLVGYDEDGNTVTFNKS